jgi:hypothetical protein
LFKYLKYWCVITSRIIIHVRNIIFGLTSRTPKRRNVALVPTSVLHIIIVFIIFTLQTNVTSLSLVESNVSLHTFIVITRRRAYGFFFFFFYSSQIVENTISFILVRPFFCRRSLTVRCVSWSSHPSRNRIRSAAVFVYTTEKLWTFLISPSKHKFT